MTHVSCLQNAEVRIPKKPNFAEGKTPIHQVPQITHIQNGGAWYQSGFHAVKDFQLLLMKSSAKVGTSVGRNPLECNEEI
jgi:hypothetical protein